ncbi:hypothetical protein TRVL_02003 [Trypanosoma vivax]|nr:hypothetical protein TRVL_02003 [Trypanosoma vivax]
MPGRLVRNVPHWRLEKTKRHRYVPSTPVPGVFAVYFLTEPVVSATFCLSSDSWALFGDFPDLCDLCRLVVPACLCLVRWCLFLTRFALRAKHLRLYRFRHCSPFGLVILFSRRCRFFLSDHSVVRGHFSASSHCFAFSAQLCPPHFVAGRMMCIT